MERKKQKAKLIKIETLYEGTLKPFGDKLRGFCPFHKDTHVPNFYIYTKTNTWYCFAGCGGGDSISYIMKLKNMQFKDAIDFLI